MWNRVEHIVVVNCDSSVLSLFLFLFTYPYARITERVLIRQSVPFSYNTVIEDGLELFLANMERVHSTGPVAVSQCRAELISLESISSHISNSLAEIKSDEAPFSTAETLLDTEL